MVKSPSLEDVLDGRVRNAHVRWNKVFAYVRRTQRYINGQVMATFDVATIEAHPQGKGHGTRFFSFVEEQSAARGLTVFVESILNDRLFDMLLRRGYAPCDTPQCLYLPPQKLL